MVTLNKACIQAIQRLLASRSYADDDFLLQGQRGPLTVPSVHRLPSDHPRQGIDQGSLKSMAQSIHEVGVISPPVVYKNPEGAFVLSIGKQRILAACSIRMRSIPCIVNNESDPAVLSLIENLHRNDLCPLDKADAFDRCIKRLNITQKAFAEIIWKSESSVSATLSLLELPSEIKEQHRRDRALSERQLLEIHNMTDLSAQHTAYKIALRRSSDMNRAKVVKTAFEIVISNAEALQNKIEQLDLRLRVIRR